MTRLVEPSAAAPLAASAYLDGQMLLALPTVNDTRFERAVIYVTEHSADGAMGLVINQPAYGLDLGQLLQQLDIPTISSLTAKMDVMRGGPVEPERGFILHSLDFQLNETQIISLGDTDYGITGTLQALKAIANGTTPHAMLFVLGYAGWGPGQLDAELRDNAWLSMPADPIIMFDMPPIQKWEAAMQKLGVNPGMLSDCGGTA